MRGYTRPRDPDRPLVCVDETSKQLLAQTRATIPMKPAAPARCDYECSCCSRRSKVGAISKAQMATPP